MSFVTLHAELGNFLFEFLANLPTTIMSSSNTYESPSAAFDLLQTYQQRDGLSVSDLMNSKIHGGLTYNDFLMLPGKIDFSASDVIADTRVTRNIVLKTPFMSSPMDTVTESEMAISMAVRSNTHICVS